MELLFSYGGHDLGRADFGDGLLRDKIDFDVGFYSGIGARDKAGALKLLYQAADEIIRQVVDGRAPEMDL